MTRISPSLPVRRGVVNAATRRRLRQARREPSRYARYKAWLDRPVAAVLLSIFFPLLLVLWWKPGFFRQVRVGLRGRLFIMYKVRTMRPDAEAETGAVWAKKYDPRLTRFGRVLRRLHLDELPQLINVLKGEMSLVGPRPERPVFVEVLAEEVPGYLDRLAVLPGVTGLAQVNLPPDFSLECVRRKLQLDMEYVEHGSLLFDLRLLACTFLRLFGLHLAPLFGLDRIRHHIVPDSHTQFVNPASLAGQFGSVDRAHESPPSATSVAKSGRHRVPKKPR